MNILDRAIAWLSPSAALSRARARIVLTEALAYEGAQTGRRNGNWARTGSSANAETAAGLKPLRDGARDLVRNNPLAASALVQFQTKLVGTGIRPQADTGNAAWNAKLNDAFDEWANETGYYGMQGLAARAIPESGEALLQFRQADPGQFSVPLTFDFLEPDHIDHLKTGYNGENYIDQGIEFNRRREEVAIWAFLTHPGDVTSTRGAKGWESKRVPVKSSNELEGIVRGFRRDRPEQIRGVSWFAPVMMTMLDLAGYEEAERVRKRIEACLSAFVTTAAEEVGAVPLGPQTKSSSGETFEEFRPGLVNRLRPGESVTIAEPKAAGGYIDFTRRHDRMIAVGLGLLYELLTGDLSNVNYSSYRGGLVGLRDWIETVQYNTLIPFFGDPVWRRFVTAAKIAGIVPSSASARVKWRPPYFDLLDREAEANADRAEVRSGFATWDQAVGRRGYDPMKQVAEIAARNADLDSKGIILDCDPRQTAGNGAARQQQQQQQQEQKP